MIWNTAARSFALVFSGHFPHLYNPAHGSAQLPPRKTEYEVFLPLWVIRTSYGPTSEPCAGHWNRACCRRGAAGKAILLCLSLRSSKKWITNRETASKWRISHVRHTSGRENPTKWWLKERPGRMEMFILIQLNLESRELQKKWLMKRCDGPCQQMKCYSLTRISYIFWILHLMHIVADSS